MDKDIQNWLNIAQYDLETAEAMLVSGRYLYVLFTCQQAVEKTLKALVVKNTRQFPPKTHDLLKLAQLAAVNLNERQNKFLANLNLYYIETRYPDEIAAVSKEVNRKVASHLLNETKEALVWLRQNLP